MLQIFVFVALLFSIVIAVFAVQNTTPVAVSFLMFRADGVAVSVLVLISAALGAAAMLLLGIAREVRMRWRTHALNQKLRATEARLQKAEAEVAAAASSTAVGEPVPALPSAPADEATAALSSSRAID
jgi:uncharacterized integral membrane protein